MLIRDRRQLFSRSKAKASTDISDFYLLMFRGIPIFLIIISVFLMIFHKANAVPVEKMKLKMMDAVAPILTTASAPIVYSFEALDNMMNFSKLRAENMHLASENKKLKGWYEEALKLEAENKSLRELLNVKVDSSIEYVTARIISDAGTSFVKSVLIPVGVNDGIEKGNAVMSGHGLVGRVTETGNKASRVLLITDLNSRIPVVIQNTRDKAILAGKNKYFMKLERLPHDSGVKVGSRVVTSGDGGQIPAEIPIGTIVSVGEDGVWVEPLAEISKLTYVQVINTDANKALVTGNLSAE